MPKPNSKTPGSVFLVATPIGNLSDISLRALDTLRDVDIIASEDTRRTGVMLKHFGIKNRQVSFHEHNEHRSGEKIMRMVSEGESVALVTSAGTPGISDPGFTLVRRAIEAGIHVSMVPGPTAFAMAVVLSGLPCHAFTYRGFPPRKPGRRKRFLSMDMASPHTLIYYESPHRLIPFLQDALEVFGDRQAAIANDLTKRYENVARGMLSELTDRMSDADLKGEYAVIIAGQG